VAQRGKVEACVAPILTAEVDRVLVDVAWLSNELHGRHEVLIGFAANFCQAARNV
jgi:hypothetical protein